MPAADGRSAPARTVSGALTVLWQCLPCLVVAGVTVLVVLVGLPDPWQRLGEWALLAGGAAAVVHCASVVVGVLRHRPAPLDGQPFRWWWPLAYAAWLDAMLTVHPDESAVLRLARTEAGVCLLLLGLAVLLARGREWWRGRRTTSEVLPPALPATTD